MSSTDKGQFLDEGPGSMYRGEPGKEVALVSAAIC